MRWGHLFSSTIRNRGLLYYRNGHVTKIQKAGNIYTGTVTGSSSHVYRVIVKEVQGIVHSMSCTCPYAQGGGSCKHEAAVLYMIDQEPEQIQNADPAKPEKPDPPLPLCSECSAARLLRRQNAVQCQTDSAASGIPAKHRKADGFPPAT